jgi:TolB-like protein/tetratricopeptide (TPR) repeat protein
MLDMAFGSRRRRMRDPPNWFVDPANALAGGERCVPRGVAKALRFMRNNLATHLSDSMIATAAGVPERTLRRQFRAFTGHSPVALHRNMRLDAARRALQDNLSDMDVTPVAAAHGFGNFGRFTAQYRRRFGELPSETVGKRRLSLVQLPPQAFRERVTLAVFPFTCGGASVDTALADVTTDRVIAALARTRWLDMLATEDSRGTIHQPHLAASRRAQYAVRGRVQAFGDRIQVTVRLTETATGHHVWGNSFDGAPESIAELQACVEEGVARNLPACLRDRTGRDRPLPAGDPAAAQLVMRAFDAASEITLSASTRALEYLDRARSIEPESPLATALAAWCGCQRAVCFLGERLDNARDEARRLTALALCSDNDDPRVLAVLAHANTGFGDLDLGEALIEKSLAIDPHNQMAWQRRGWIAIYRDRSSALADFSRALALNPHGRDRFSTMLGTSQAYFLMGQYDQATKWAMRGLEERPLETWACRIAVVAQACSGRIVEAQRNVVRLRRQYPDASVGAMVNVWERIMPPEFLARNAEGLESAGLPI